MQIKERLENKFPTPNAAINSEVLKLLVYAKSETVTAAAVKLMVNAPTQEEQIDYAKTLRHQLKGWTPELRREYFERFLQAANYRGAQASPCFLRILKKMRLQVCRRRILSH